MGSVHKFKECAWVAKCMNTKGSDVKISKLQLVTCRGWFSLPSSQTLASCPFSLSIFLTIDTNGGIDWIDRALSTGIGTRSLRDAHTQKYNECTLRTACYQHLCSFLLGGTRTVQIKLAALYDIEAKLHSHIIHCISRFSQGANWLVFYESLIRKAMFHL